VEDRLSLFIDQKYVNLETYKKDGTPVRTPVWFMIDGDIVYVVTREKTGKVKRLKNNQNIRIVPCSFKGKPESEWMKGIAQKVTGEEAEKAIKLRKKKYGFSARLTGLFTSQKGNPIVYSIKLSD
jgi:PPOX class probable F420-dependent enzyme